LHSENSHKAASEGKSSSVVARLVIWMTVDGIAAETNTATVQLNSTKTKSKPATRLDHGHKLNNAKLKRNCKANTRV
jgi:hypothetical protein